MKLLIVDDNQNMAETLGDILVEHGYEVQKARDIKTSRCYQDREIADPKDGGQRRVSINGPHRYLLRFAGHDRGAGRDLGDLLFQPDHSASYGGL